VEQPVAHRLAGGRVLRRGLGRRRALPGRHLLPLRLPARQLQLRARLGVPHPDRDRRPGRLRPLRHKPCLHGRISDAAANEGRGAPPTARCAMPSTARRAASCRSRTSWPQRRRALPGLRDRAVRAAAGLEHGLHAVPQLRPRLPVRQRGAAPARALARGVRDGWRHRGRRWALLMGVALAWWGLLNAFAMVPPFFATADALAARSTPAPPGWCSAVLFLGVTVLGRASRSGRLPRRPRGRRPARAVGRVRPLGDTWGRPRRSGSGRPTTCSTS
jgi:hypothetical protein